MRTRLSKFRFSIRWKIILPFFLLAALITIGVVVLISRTVHEADDVRFYRQVVDSGQQAVDEVVRSEKRLLEVQRAIANTEGVAEAVALRDAETLRARVLQLVINTETDMAVILDRGGTSLLAVRKSSPDAPAGEYITVRGEDFYREWPFVQRLLKLTGPVAGDGEEGGKQVGLHAVRLGEKDEYVFLVGGALEEENGAVFGAVLAGEYLSNQAALLSEVSNARVTVYDAETGSVLATVFDENDPWDPPGLALTPGLVETALRPDGSDQPYRTIGVAGQSYGEVLTRYSARDGEEELGVLGISLLGGEDPDALYRQYQERIQAIAWYGLIVLALVLLVGLLVSAWITRPIVQLREASNSVIEGDLDMYVPEGGRDEIGDLSRSFNRMVTGIREESFYRTILGESSDAETKDQLRRTIVMGGGVTEGQRLKAAVLYTCVRGLARNPEHDEPTQVIEEVGRVIQTILAIIREHSGVPQEVTGDSVGAYFGVLPRNLPLQVSTLQATHAGMEILDYLHRVNERRTAEGLAALDAGIGIATGVAIAGAIKGRDSLQYLLVGEPVSLSKRIQEVTRPISGGTLLISAQAHEYLSGGRSEFEFGRFGKTQLKDEGREVGVYEVVGRTSKLIDCSGLDLEERPTWPAVGA
jgi:class 3 adenylate cyclase